MRAGSPPRLMLVTGLGLGLVTSAVFPARAAHEEGRMPRAKTVVFAPLFDAATRFKVREQVELRFRARDAVTGVPVRAADLAISLRHGESGRSIPMRARQVKPGVFALSFKPHDPGQYWIAAEVQGAATQPQGAIRLGVVGVAEGLVEVAPEEDPDVRQHKGKIASRVR